MYMQSNFEINCFPFLCTSAMLGLYYLFWTQLVSSVLYTDVVFVIVCEGGCRKYNSSCHCVLFVYVKKGDFAIHSSKSLNEKVGFIT